VLASGLDWQAAQQLAASNTGSSPVAVFTSSTSSAPSAGLPAADAIHSRGFNALALMQLDLATQLLRASCMVSGRAARRARQTSVTLAPGYTWRDKASLRCCC